MYLRLKPLVTHLEVENKVEKVKRAIDETFKAFSIRKDCVKDKNDTLSMVKGINAKLAELQTDMGNAQDDLMEFRVKIDHKAEIYEVADM